MADDSYRGCPMNHGDNPGSESKGHDGLSTERVVSSIPKSGTSDASNWIYPSEQMFFDAMRRKNWNPEKNDMSLIVPIHNAINEECWRQILKWESLHESECSQPKLLKFQGKPKEYSLKARMWRLLGYKYPFDRHDWTVDRCGHKIEYIIDFYPGARNNFDLSTSFYLDVRPKLTLCGLKDRLTLGIRSILKGSP